MEGLLTVVQWPLKALCEGHVTDRRPGRLYGQEGSHVRISRLAKENGKCKSIQSKQQNALAYHHNSLWLGSCNSGTKVG